MAYANTVNGRVHISNTKLSGDWSEITRIPESVEYRDTWYLDGTEVKEDLEAVRILDEVSAAKSSKVLRTAALDALTYDFGDGRVMQVRPKDEANILRAIKIMAKYEVPTTDWVMLDNKKYPVTVEELETAMESGLLAGMQVWADYAP